MRETCRPDRQKTLLLLPGSRKGEVTRLLGPFGETVSELEARGHRLRLVMPTVPHVERRVADAVSGWRNRPEIVLDQQRKWQSFGEADAALVASGTVSLELALCGVPLVSCYKLDPLMRLVQHRITVWSALLPNLIADRPVAPEYYDRYVRPPMLARHIEQLFGDTPLRTWQKQGFDEVRRRMSTARPAGEAVAEIVLRHVRRGGGFRPLLLTSPDQQRRHSKTTLPVAATTSGSRRGRVHCINSAIVGMA